MIKKQVADFAIFLSLCRAFSEFREKRIENSHELIKTVDN